MSVELQRECDPTDLALLDGHSIRETLCDFGSV